LFFSLSPPPLQGGGEIRKKEEEEGINPPLFSIFISPFLFGEEENQKEKEGEN